MYSIIMCFRRLMGTVHVASDAETHECSVSHLVSEIMTWFKLNKVKNHEILKYLHETSFSFSESKYCKSNDRFKKFKVATFKTE